jgi:hypothetical protein
MTQLQYFADGALVEERNKLSSKQLWLTDG